MSVNFRFVNLRTIHNGNRRATVFSPLFCILNKMFLEFLCDKIYPILSIYEKHLLWQFTYWCNKLFLSIHLSLVFVFSSFSNIPKLNLAYGLTPALLLAPTKHTYVYVNYTKLAIVANSDIMTTLAFHLLFSRPSNASLVVYDYP